MLTWSRFEKTSKNVTADFEDLCRLFFKIYYLKDSTVILNKIHNNAGVETDPAIVDGILVGFQAKYFTNQISYTDIYDSCAKIVTHYNKKINKVILFCNKDINPKVQTYIKAVKLLEANQIEIELCCNQNILDPINMDDNYAKIKALFFNEQSFSLQWFRDKLSQSLEDLEPRYNTGFHIQDNELQQHFGIIYQDETVKSYLQNIIDEAKNELKQIIGYNDIVQSISVIIESFYIPDKAHYACIFEWYSSLISIYNKIFELDNELNKKYESSFNRGSQLSEENRRDLINSLTNCRRLRGIVERFDFTQDEYLKNLQKHIFIVEGEAGNGKSHLLGYEAETHGISQNYRTVLLLGQQFIFDNKPQEQIKNILGLQCSFEDFLLACEAKGEVDGELTVIMIDAVNECSNYNIWKQYINGLINKISSLKFVKLVLSIRTTYISYVFSEKLVADINKEIIPIIKVLGFRNNLLDAIPKFFNYYKIPLTTSAYFEAEFENPLFLKTYCESYTEGMAVGSRGIFSLYSAFLEKEEKKVREQQHISTSASFVNEIVNVIGKYMYENSRLYIPLKVLYANCKDVPNSDKVIDAFLRAKVLVQYKHDDGDRVFLNYERFSDYIVAKYILDSTKSFEQLCEKVEKEMLTVNAYGNLPSFMEGRFAAVSLLAREKYNKELIICLDSIPKTDQHDLYLLSGIVTEYLDSYRYRADKDIDAKDFKKDVIPYMCSKQNYDKFWEVLISLAGRNCSLNAKAITSILMPMALNKRDYLWTLYINQEASQGSRIYNIVQYFLNCDTNILAHQEKLLYGQLLTWFLSASNRKLRDLSSRALIRVLRNDVPAWIEILSIFKDVNDPYIISRLYGCVYGALLLTPENILCENNLTDLCDYIYQNIFNKDIVYPDILLRDYALNILEYCKFKNLIQDLDIQHCRPPYKSFPIPNISREELENIYPEPSSIEWLGTTAIKASLAPNYNLDGFANAYLYGDFGRYTFQSALNEFKDVDIKKVFYYAYYYIIKELGYNNNFFSQFDKSVGYGRMRNYAYVERIGKKYEWIAMYHALALVSDTCPIINLDHSISSYKGSWCPYVRDFDPTLTIFSNNRPYKNQPITLTRQVYTGWRLEDTKWAHIEDAWSFTDNISILDENNEKWYSLNFYISDSSGKDFNKPNQTVWLMGTACLIKKTEKETFIKKIQDKSFYGRWFDAAEPDSCYTVFAREYTWAPAYREEYKNSSFKDAEIQTGEQTFTKEFPTVKFQLDNDDLEDCDCYIENETQEVTMPIMEVIGHILPCSHEYLWEEEYDCSKEDAIHIRMPHKFLVDLLNLKQTKDGVWQAGNEIACADFNLFDGSNVNGLYIREKYLRQLLADEYSIIWICIGEKQHLLGTPGVHGQIWSELSCLVYEDDSGKLQEIRKIKLGKVRN